MKEIIEYGYKDGINDAYYDIVTKNYHFPKVDKINVLSKVYDYYYVKGYNDLINFIIDLFK